MLAAFFLTHAWHFFFQPGGGAQWYTGNVYGNLVAIVPTGLIFFLYLRSRHLAVLAAHEELKLAHVEHAAKLDKLLDHFDPDTPGPMTDVLDRLDLHTPGGVTDLLKALEPRLSAIDTRLAAKPGREYSDSLSEAATPVRTLPETPRDDPDARRA
jgi:hypothetical protein